MKKHILGLLFLSVTGTCLTSCGDDFLDTKNYSGVDVDNGLTDASSVSNAVMVSTIGFITIILQETLQR